MSDKPTNFISCGQFTEDEISLGKEVCKLIEALTPCAAYFAQNQSSLDGLTHNILGALNDCIGLIVIMHPRGVVEIPSGKHHVRGSIWIEQEVAIAAFLNQVLGKDLRIAAYIHEDIAREGMRDKLHLNPISFQSNAQVLEHLAQILPAWKNFSTKGQDYVEHVEALCVATDNARFQLLLERLREELIDGWHEIGAFEPSAEIIVNPAKAIPKLRGVVEKHKQEVFLPAMHRLTLTALAVIRANAPPSFLEFLILLLGDVFESSHSLSMMRSLMPRGEQSVSPKDHLSHTVPALESLISLHIIGAYIAKRDRFQFLPTMFRADVTPAGGAANDGMNPKRVMAFWPLLGAWGEPKELSHAHGRIDLCTSKIVTDTEYSRFFGSASAIRDALCQYEFCLEFNSFLAVSDDTPETVAYVKKRFGETQFLFVPTFVTLPLDPVMKTAQKIYGAIKENQRALLAQFLFDPNLTGFLCKDGGDKIYLNFLMSLAKGQAQWYMGQYRNSPFIIWPEEIRVAMKEIT